MSCRAVWGARMLLPACCPCAWCTRRDCILHISFLIRGTLHCKLVLAAGQTGAHGGESTSEAAQQGLVCELRSHGVLGVKCLRYELKLVHIRRASLLYLNLKSNLCLIWAGRAQGRSTWRRWP